MWSSGSSWSAVENDPTTVPTPSFSATVNADRSMSVGPSFTSDTSIVKTCSNGSDVVPSSVVRTRMLRPGWVS